jgi:hypothetical protein
VAGTAIASGPVRGIARHRFAGQILALVVVSGICGLDGGTRDQPGNGRREDQFFLCFGHKFIGFNIASSLLQPRATAWHGETQPALRLEAAMVKYTILRIVQANPLSFMI